MMGVPSHLQKQAVRRGDVQEAYFCGNLDRLLGFYVFEGEDIDMPVALVRSTLPRGQATAAVMRDVLDVAVQIAGDIDGFDFANLPPHVGVEDYRRFGRIDSEHETPEEIYDMAVCAVGDQEDGGRPAPYCPIRFRRMLAQHVAARWSDADRANHPLVGVCLTNEAGDILRETISD